MPSKAVTVRFAEKEYERLGGMRAVSTFRTSACRMRKSRRQRFDAIARKRWGRVFRSRCMKSAFAHSRIRQLEALLRIGPAANIAPLMRERSRTTQMANPADVAMASRRKSGEKIPLVEKIARG